MLMKLLSSVQRLHKPIFSSEFLPKFYPKKRVITTFATKKSALKCVICDKKNA